MIHYTAPLNWYEGMFLQSHHFQTSHNRMLMQNKEQIVTTPCWWGLSSLTVDKDALQRFYFIINRGVLRLFDGTWVSIPGNAVVSAKSFKEEFSKKDGLSVWLGIKRYDPNVSSVHQLGEDAIGTSRIFVTREVEVEDENVGGNQQAIQVKLFNLLLFFGASPGDQYEVIKIAEIIRSPQTDLIMLDPVFIPPVINIGAAPGLKEKVKNLVVHLQNQTSYLRREVSEKKNLISSDPTKILSILLRTQIVASFSCVIGQLQTMDETHPLQLYLELARLAGSLASISPEVPLDIPEYNHNNLTVVMERLLSLIWNMLEGGVMPEYIKREFEIQQKHRICRIDRQWLDNEYAVYLCVKTDMPETQLDSILSDVRVKIGPSSRIDELLSERRRGLSCPRIRRVPLGLQDRSGFHYFRVDLTRNSEFWEDFYRDLIFEIRGIPSNVLPDMTLFVHIAKDKQ
ncbi:MAG: type VI secretion system baseplate subunit TssK [Desulfamplus sp.]|nr:type VI secretion system baseplate subunit TssK [Desulfamplus sp.]